MTAANTGEPAKPELARVSHADNLAGPFNKDKKR